MEQNGLTGLNRLLTHFRISCEDTKAMIREFSDKYMTKEDKNSRGKLWATDDNGRTFWFDSLDDALQWMAEHNKDFAAKLASKGRQSFA
jgi:hypothetical protein